jgi:hypothetical protein
MSLLYVGLRRTAEERLQLQPLWPRLDRSRFVDAAFAQRTSCRGKIVSEPGKPRVLTLQTDRVEILRIESDGQLVAQRDSSQAAFILQLDSNVVQGLFESLANLFDLPRLYHQWRSEHQPVADHS